MAAIDPCEYEEITIQSDQGFSVDLRLGVVSFQYFEDLFSPTITAKMVIVSTSGVVSSDKTKKIESLYNTYRYKGLPPGPIGMPDISSIEAVLNYEKHDYLYFVVSPSKPGYHLFSKSLNKHNENKKKYTRWLNKNKIYR